MQDYHKIRNDNDAFQISVDAMKNVLSHQLNFSIFKQDSEDPILFWYLFKGLSFDDKLSMVVVVLI